MGLELAVGVPPHLGDEAVTPGRGRTIPEPFRDATRVEDAQHPTWRDTREVTVEQRDGLSIPACGVEQSESDEREERGRGISPIRNVTGAQGVREHGEAAQRLGRVLPGQCEGRARELVAPACPLDLIPRPPETSSLDG